MKPYYDEDGIAIYHGDCREVLPMSRVTVAITDPPYGRAFHPTDLPPDLAVLRQLVEMNQTAAIIGYPELLVDWIVCAPLPVPVEWVTWWPTNRHCFGRPKLLPRESEHVALFGEVSGARSLTRLRSNRKLTPRQAARNSGSSEVLLGDVWRDQDAPNGSNIGQRLHPNEKPLSLMQKLVLLCSRPGDTILDPFMGSGTTLLAAKNLGRKAVGIEIDEFYCGMAAKRLGQMVLDVEPPWTEADLTTEEDVERNTHSAESSEELARLGLQLKGDA